MLDLWMSVLPFGESPYALTSMALDNLSAEMKRLAINGMKIEQ